MVLPRVDNYLKVEILPICLLHISIVNPLRPGDIREVLEHDEVLTLYVGLSILLLLALLLLVPGAGEVSSETETEHVSTT